MIAALLLLAAGTTGVAQTIEQLNATEAKAREAMDKVFACMDELVKQQFLKNALDATPHSVVDEALSACSYLKQTYASAVTTDYIPPDKAQELADDWFKSLRDTYVAHVEKQLVDPGFADARTKVGVADWRKCITDQASEWSRLSDEAQSVARAAVTACASFRPRVQAVVTYDLRSKQLPVTGASQVMETLDKTLEDVAVETVISERAKRLPKSGK
jgi:hypothetical protein